jgi:hypothetical protein
VGLGHVANLARPGGNITGLTVLLTDGKLNNVDPLAWMTNVLAKLVNLWPASRVEELMPWAYVKLMQTGR